MAEERLAFGGRRGPELGEPGLADRFWFRFSVPALLETAPPPHPAVLRPGALGRGAGTWDSGCQEPPGSFATFETKLESSQRIPRRECGDFPRDCVLRAVEPE